MKLIILYLFLYNSAAYLLNYEDSKVTQDAEHKIINEMIESTEPRKNLVMFVSTLEIPCITFTCEKYSKLGISLNENGKSDQKHLQQIPSLKNITADKVFNLTCSFGAIACTHSG